MLYRIFTADVNNEAVKRIVAESFEGFTVLHGLGYWRGVAEDSLIIEIDDGDGSKVHEVARRIKAENHQEAVLIQRIVTEAVLL